jgi:hypothetical protein
MLSPAPSDSKSVPLVPAFADAAWSWLLLLLLLLAVERHR